MAACLRRVALAGCVSVGLLAPAAPAVTRYVWTNSPSPGAGHLSWETAARTIQAAVDAAVSNDTILVTNGVYDSGGRAVYGSLTNRVAIDRPVTVRSVNGPDVTVVRGPGMYGVVEVRCAYVGHGARLEGLTLTNGWPRQWDGDVRTERSGGGVWCEPDGVVSNCLITGCGAMRYGGGAFGGLLVDCTLAGNNAYSGGGGACSGVLFRCTLRDNESQFSGGGALGSALSHCTLSNNVAGFRAGGAYLGILEHCNVVGNTSWDSGGGTFGSALTHCDLRGNTASFGGGGACEGLLTDCTLTGNHSGSQGGGAHVATLVRCACIGNTAKEGGGVYHGVSSNCIFRGNSAEEGGGAHQGALYDCTFTSNSATDGGGAIYSTLYDCSFTRNTAASRGGGTAWGTLYRCALNGNRAWGSGGGAYNGKLYDCALVGNAVTNNGGGASEGTLSNCTLVSNVAASAGGAYYETLYNCILWNNVASRDPNWSGGALRACCTTPLPTGVGNITNAPLFADAAAGDFRLQPGSPCVNRGTNQAWMVGARDLAGHPRVIGGCVDMGALESTNGATAAGLPWGWLVEHGLATDGSADARDADGDGASTEDEFTASTNPTNRASRLAITALQPRPEGTRLAWQGGVDAWQYVQCASRPGATGALWQTVFTSAPPTPASATAVLPPGTNRGAFYRLKAVRR